MEESRSWLVTIFDKRDNKLCEKKCQTLAQVAQLFGRTKACDLSHLLYRVSDENKRKKQMLQRWGLYFTLERQHGPIPEQIKLAITEAAQAEAKKEKQ